jgi:hypothetical protein
MMRGLESGQRGWHQSGQRGLAPKRPAGAGAPTECGQRGLALPLGLAGRSCSSGESGLSTVKAIT